MRSFPDSTDAGIESEVIDLSSVSWASLRTLDGPELRRAVLREWERTAYVQVAVGGSGGAERID
ncbi:hypothetical protein [Amycolatopsis sp. H20-H5]|uniref:hypothetical protein n=1 Tax=Amycolatopsis sp. H20-H5 TaxID=3046309 RepID=UPI002DB7B7A7|nr:hypothetical protein [Amycolatopsis sp. H20-H5]MEC3977829.1 hypothetical protein [Amycolatopsis sp. H20-H5]